MSAFTASAFRAAVHAATEPVKQLLHGYAARAALGHYTELKATYPVVTGVLRDRVLMGERGPGRWWTKSAAPHVHLYEKGTKQRGDPTRPNPQTGRPANRGTMPAARVFVTLAVKHRSTFYRDGQAVLDRTHEIG